MKNAGDTESLSGLGRSPGEGNGNPLQYSCLENFMDSEWWATVHKAAKSWTQLSNFTFFLSFFLSFMCISIVSLPSGPVVRNPPAGDTCSIPVLGRSPGEGNGNPIQYSCLSNS